MPDISLKINGLAITVPEKTSVAVAIYKSGAKVFRSSITGQARGPVCGMGICYECCVTVDGSPYIRSCMTLCREGMEVTTT